MAGRWPVRRAVRRVWRAPSSVPVWGVASAGTPACRTVPARGLSDHHITDYDGYLSDVSKRRRPSAIRALQPLLALPGMISLGGGMPNPKTFPITKLQFSIEGRQEPIVLSDKELADALQYSPTTGLPRLNQLLVKLQSREHLPPNDCEVCITNGSQEAMVRAFEMLLNPGDSILLENPTYSGALAALDPMSLNYAPVATDDLGLVPESLAEVLETWPENGPHPKPRVLYTIPTGSNPTGASQPIERKFEVYALAQRHNLVILEDDPYYYLQFGNTRTRSYLSMDTDGRVLRFDSFSKILASGLRVGFVTGPKGLVDRIHLHGQAASLHPSGISQAITLALLSHLGHEGFLEHVAKVRSFYVLQRDCFLESAEQHLGGLAEWNRDISAGMFSWLRLVGVEDSEQLIKVEAAKAKVLLVPGSAFSPLRGSKSPYVRAAFSTASGEEMDEALSRLAKILRHASTSAPNTGGTS